MVLRIEIDLEDPSAIGVALSGNLSSSRLPELRRLIDEALQAHRRVDVDLSKITLIDREAVRFFVSGEGRRVAIVGCPSYVREWMQCEARRTGEPS